MQYFCQSAVLLWRASLQNECPCSDVRHYIAMPTGSAFVAGTAMSATKGSAPLGSTQRPAPEKGAHTTQHWPSGSHGRREQGRRALVGSCWAESSTGGIYAVGNAGLHCACIAYASLDERCTTGGGGGGDTRE
jgi:hypothetical protein